MGPPTGATVRAPISNDNRPSPITQTQRMSHVSQPGQQYPQHPVNYQHPRGEAPQTRFRTSQPEQQYPNPQIAAGVPQTRFRTSQPEQQYPNPQMAAAVPQTTHRTSQPEQPEQQYHQPTNNQYSNSQSEIPIPEQQTNIHTSLRGEQYVHSSVNNAYQNQPASSNNEFQDPSVYNYPGVSSATSNRSTEYEPIEDGGDSIDGYHRSRFNVNVNVCTEEEVSASTGGLFTSFIVDRMEHDGYGAPPGLASRERKQNESHIAAVLRQMGDDISKNAELNHFIGEIQVTPNTAYKTFASVASQIFTDGSINWGRVVMLFYFAYKLAIQVINQVPLIDIIINWVTKFVKERLAAWISRNGGWNALRDYYGSTTAQMVGVFLAGVLLSTLFWYWRK